MCIISSCVRRQMGGATHNSLNERNAGKRMRACLCWNCSRLCECEKIFPDGRPKRKSECAEYMKAPPDQTRITHKEMADILGCSRGKIAGLIAAPNGVGRLMKAFARRGIMLTYELGKNRILFYKEEDRNG